MSHEARIVVAWMVIMNVFGFMSGTINASVDGWKHPWRSYRNAFLATYFLVGGLAVMAGAAIWAKL